MDKEKHYIGGKEFNLLDIDFQIINNVPPRFKKVKEDKKQIYDFFDKIPENKVMQIAFPNESLWNSYSIALRYYASEYPFILQFNKRKDDRGYFIYITKLKRVEDEKNLEIKSI